MVLLGENLHGVTAGSVLRLLRILAVRRIMGAESLIKVSCFGISVVYILMIVCLYVTVYAVDNMH